MHVFNTEAEKEPLTTLNLKKTKVVLKKETRFDAVETWKGLFGQKKNTVGLRAKTLGDMQDWIKAI